MIKPRKILTYRFDIADSLIKLNPDDTFFPYRFRWSSFGGKHVKNVDVVCDKNKAIYIDISYYEDK